MTAEGSEGTYVTRDGFDDGLPRCKTRDVALVLGWRPSDVQSRLDVSGVSYARRAGSMAAWITRSQAERLIRDEIAVAYAAGLADRVSRLRQGSGGTR
jgi:hypothetical protein